MEPTTNEWIAAFEELKIHPELPRLLVQKYNDWSFVAERQVEDRQVQRKGKGVAITYYKSKIYNIVTYW